MSKIQLWMDFFFLLNHFHWHIDQFSFYFITHNAVWLLLLMLQCSGLFLLLKHSDAAALYSGTATTKHNCIIQSSFTAFWNSLESNLCTTTSWLILISHATLNVAEKWRVRKECSFLILGANSVPLWPESITQPLMSHRNKKNTATNDKISTQYVTSQWYFCVSGSFPLCKPVKEKTLHYKNVWACVWECIMTYPKVRVGLVVLYDLLTSNTKTMSINT